MKTGKISPDRSQVRDLAGKVLAQWGADSEVRLQVDALIGSLDDTLSNEVVLEELRALESTGMPFSEVFADGNQPSTTPARQE